MKDAQAPYSGYYNRASCDVNRLRSLTKQDLDPQSVPHAGTVEKNVPIYDMIELASHLEDPDKRRVLMAEWAHVLDQTSGVIVLKSAYPDTSSIDRASDVFRAIIAEEKSGTAGKGDHFAASGANDRIWNSLQKHCLHDPEGFALYFGNPAIAAAAEAWLGPNYQMTAQVNQVRPGGKAQSAHRDYHLGFQSAEGAARYPAHAHHVTATLTLQGAIAHCDMPVISGPTKLLPFSQLYDAGYIGFHLEDHRAYFEEAYIQLALEKGDAVFFNPALFHAAGENKSADIDRMVNLLQVSSAFGRAMETIDRDGMSRALFPVLNKPDLGMSAHQIDAAIASTAEGYAFPTNLDTDPPIGGNAPQSQADLFRHALAQGWSDTEFGQALDDLRLRQRP